MLNIFSEISQNSNKNYKLRTDIDQLMKDGPIGQADFVKLTAGMSAAEVQKITSLLTTNNESRKSRIENKATTLLTCAGALAAVVAAMAAAITFQSFSLPAAKWAFLVLFLLPPIAWIGCLVYAMR